MILLFISVDEVIPSAWIGNYTCQDDNIMRQFVMNFDKSPTYITVEGSMLIELRTLNISGTFATALKYLTIQSQNVVLNEIFGRNFTNVEINAKFETELLIKGVIILLNDSLQGTIKCPVELRRTAGMLFYLNIFDKTNYKHVYH